MAGGIATALRSTPSPTPRHAASGSAMARGSLTPNTLGHQSSVDPRKGQSEQEATQAAIAGAFAPVRLRFANPCRGASDAGADPHASPDDRQEIAHASISELTPGEDVREEDEKCRSVAHGTR